MSTSRQLISSDSPLEASIGFSRAVRVGDLICVAGTAPVGPDGSTIGVGNPEAQARRCLDIVRTALDQAGSSLGDVVRTRVLLTRIGDWPLVAKVHGEIFGSVRPACTVFQVSSFIDPTWLVELEVDAVVGSKQAVPVFGERVAGQRYAVRPSAYAVIQNERHEFAVVATPAGLFLPGGGIEIGETPEHAIVRETLEECGLVVQPTLTIAKAIQLVHSLEESTYLEKPSVFLRAVIKSGAHPPSEPDHRLLWLSGESAARGMTHESHAWVLRLCAV